MNFVNNRAIDDCPFSPMGVGASSLGRILKADAPRRKRTMCSTLVPRGYVPIYVGDVDKEMKLFVVHTTSLCDAEFTELLFKSAEKYGYENQGVLKIPFDATTFEDWMQSSRSRGWKVMSHATRSQVPYHIV